MHTERHSNTGTQTEKKKCGPNTTIKTFKLWEYAAIVKLGEKGKKQKLTFGPRIRAAMLNDGSGSKPKNTHVLSA
jgi:hypothetical protein